MTETNVGKASGKDSAGTRVDIINKGQKTYTLLKTIEF